MNAFHIALKDLQIFVRDRGSLVNLFLLPLVFIVVLTSSMQSFVGEDQDERVNLPVVNLDPSGEMAQVLIEQLNDGGGFEVELYERDEAQTRLENLNLLYVLIIPSDFTDKISANESVTLRLLTHPDASESTIDSLARSITGVSQEMSLETQLIAGFEQMGDMEATSPEGTVVFSNDKIVAQARSQIERSQSEPLIVVESMRPASLGEEVEEPNAIQQNAPGYTIIFVFLTAQATAFSIYREKREGSFRRLLAAPISKVELLVGKMIPNFITGLIQIGVIFTVSILILPLIGLDRLTLGKDPLALIVVSLLVALCSTGLGIFIAALARTEAQIGGISALALWMMGAVGGCLFPPFLLGGLLDTIGKLVPHHWAIQAYQDLIVRGRTLADVTTELLVLLGFSLAFFIVGLWRFDFD